MTKTALVLGSDRMRVGLDLRGGVLTFAETRDGRPFLRRGAADDPAASACFPMVPLCNRVGGNSFVFSGRDYHLHPNRREPLYLHGDGWLERWTFTQRDKSSATLTFTSPGNGPYEYRAWQKVAVVGDRLTLTLGVTNEADRPMPFGLGFHPYFPRDGAEIRFGADHWWRAGPDHLPISRDSLPPWADFHRKGALPEMAMNNAYGGWDGRALIDWPHCGVTVDLRADPLFDTVMLYAPADDLSFFCLEPMSHLPNAVNMPGQPGVRPLGPGDSLAGSIILTVHQTESGS